MVLLSYLPQDITTRYTDYVPSLVELVSSAGIVAYGLLAFTLGARFLNVVDHRLAHAEAPASVASAILAAAD